MALNTCKCNYLTPLHFKGLKLTAVFCLQLYCCCCCYTPPVALFSTRYSSFVIVVLSVWLLQLLVLCIATVQTFPLYRSKSFRQQS